MTPTEVGLTPAERAVVRDAARCMVQVGKNLAARKGTRCGSPYKGPTPDDIVSAYTTNFRLRIRLLSATVDRARGSGDWISYVKGADTQYRHGGRSA